MTSRLIPITLALVLLCPQAHASHKPKVHHKHPIAHVIGQIALKVVEIPLLPLFFLIDIGAAS